VVSDKNTVTIFLSQFVEFSELSIFNINSELIFSSLGDITFILCSHNSRSILPPLALANFSRPVTKREREFLKRAAKDAERGIKANLYSMA
jgi:hypothetical protein